MSVDYLLGNTSDKTISLQIEKNKTEIPDMETTLLYFFSNCDTKGQYRIIQVAMNEFDRTAKEKTDTPKDSIVV